VSAPGLPPSEARYRVPTTTSTATARLRERWRYFWRGDRLGAHWQDDHSCVLEDHDHPRCTHALCLDGDCEATGCHVATVPRGAAVHYEWQHHPRWRTEALVEADRRAVTGAESRAAYDRQQRRRLYREGLRRPRF
jgi:hypothetical protein